MAQRTKLQFVWPKDGPHGSRRRGFFGRLNDVLHGTGPDIFLQEKRSRESIPPDFWGNWDSYQDRACHDSEANNPISFGPFNPSRGLQRYDPHTRKYVKWATDHDWDGAGTHGWGIRPNGHGYPRFTEDERRRLRRMRRRGGIEPHKMGNEWTIYGPKRFEQAHDWFWQEAFRRRENIREGYHPLSGINPHMRMHQEWPDDIDRWMRWEGI